MSAQRASTASDVGSSAERDARRLRSGIIWTLALALLLLGIGFAVPDLREVLRRVAHAATGWLLLALALEVASCLGYVATVRLVLHRGPAREVRRLAWAEMAFGAVVQVGGAGGLAVGAWAMRAWGISWTRIANRSAVIFLLTSAINCVVLALAGLGIWLGIGATDRAGVVYGLLPAGIGLGAIAFFWLLPRVSARRIPGRLGRALDGMASWVTATEQVAVKPNWRLLGAVGYLLFDIAVLWACLRAVGTHPPVLALVAGYQIGYLANVVPIPGGLGVLDGGLLGALVLYGLPPAPAAAAVILYHTIALWLPTLGGTYAFARMRATVAAQARRVNQAPGALGAPGANGTPAGGPAASSAVPAAAETMLKVQPWRAAH